VFYGPADAGATGVRPCAPAAHGKMRSPPLERAHRVCGMYVARPRLHPTAFQQMTAHHFTVDVEEYFQVSAFERHVSRERWTELESRVTASVERLLHLLGEQQVRGTFFVLGWVGARHPRLVRSIAGAGHEIASHGFDHRRVTRQSPAEFRESARSSRSLLEDLAGAPVRGFRAPSFSIVPGYEWALDILVEEGYTYDSSLFPIRRRGYGYAGAPRDPHWIARPAGRLLEVPPATLSWCGLNLPAAGGAYFRFFPYRLVHAALRAAERRGVPATFYIHPWELDPEQPRLPVALPTRIRHYAGLDKTEARLRRLLGEFRFAPIAETCGTARPRAQPAPAAAVVAPSP
jgi:polysaccharide deacetylase family protein (PEP-CTERM system associated)